MLVSLEGSSVPQEGSESKEEDRRKARTDFKSILIKIQNRSINRSRKATVIKVAAATATTTTVTQQQK